MTADAPALTPAVKAAAMEHAVAASPRESCGLAVVVEGRQIYWPCTNAAEDPEQDFQIDRLDLMAAEDAGAVVAVLHSHPFTPPLPSDADRQVCSWGGIPWFICNPTTGTWGPALLPETYQAPLLGRRWVWAVHDCWSLVRDWYQLEMGRTLRDWPRPARARDFEADPMFERLWPEAGFVEIHDRGQLQPGDAILMGFGQQRLNHVGVYVGGNQLLHHVRGRLSSRDVYDQDWQDRTGWVGRLAP
jgi:proteasome lid subunit RPN8/RPN11